MAEFITDSNFEQEVLFSEKPVLVDFWASWCGSCRKLAPVIKEISETCSEKVKVRKINVDDCPNLAKRYNVSDIPTVILFRSGKAVSCSVGYRAKEQLLQMI